MTFEQIIQSRFGEMLFVIAQQEAQIASLVAENARLKAAATEQSPAPPLAHNYMEAGGQ